MPAVRGQGDVRGSWVGGRVMKGNKLSADVTTILPRESFDLADEKRFQTLRKHLTDEGYTQVLGFESVPLVHRLWDDLCALRDTHTTMARNLSEKGANEAKLQRQIHPIQKELSRMVRENNQLHLELIQRSEEFDTHQRRTSLDTNKFQTKIADQAFIISQQAHHIRELEKQVDEYRGKIDKLLDPNFTYTTGPAGETVPKGQEIIVSACPKPHEVGGDEGEVAQVVQDLESITADQIAELEEDLKESNRKHEFLELEVHSLKEAIRNREQEIMRMGKLLVNNVNSDKEDLETINSNNEDSIRRLNNQLDFVSGELADAERQKVYMKQLADEVETLRGSESKLKSALASTNAELSEVREAMHMLHPTGPARSAGGVPTPAKPGLREDMNPVSGEASKTSAALNTDYSGNIARMRQEDPAVTEASDEAHTGHSPTRQSNEVPRRQQTVQELEALLRKRESESSKLREEVVLGQQKLSESHAKCEQVGGELTEMKRLRDNLYAVVWDFENQMAEVQVKIRELVSAREEKSRQCSEAWDKVKMLEQELATSGTRSGGSLRASSERGRGNYNQVSDANSEKVAKLLDELKYYKGRVKELEAQVEKADEELAAWAVNDASVAACSPRAAGGPGNTELNQENQALRISLSASQQHVETLKAELQRLVGEYEKSGGQMGPMEAKLAEKERAIEQLQSLMSNMDETRGQVVAQLKVHMEGAQVSKQQIGLLESEVKRLLGELRRHEHELDRSRAAITDIDGERDTLLNQLDEKTQMVRTLDARLNEALRERDTSLADVTSAEQQADMLRQALNERDAHNKLLRQELHTEVQNRKGAEQLCNAKIEEARVLSADLNTMTRENQVVNDELAVVVAQRDALKRDLDEALQRLTVAQQMLQGGGKERQDILMSYRALNDEKQRAEAATNRVAMELHQVRAQVYAREEELMRAREAISALEQEQQRTAIDVMGLQRHSDLMSEKLLEAQDRAAQDAADREALNKELAACKNVAALVEKQKHDAVREGALLRDEIVALRGKVSNLGAERDLLRGTLEAEKGKVRDLEDLLCMLRAKEHAAVTAEHAAASDSVGLNQRLQAALTENEKNQQEMRLLRSRREELEYELEKKRRLVTHEAMEADSAATELSTLRTNARELHFVVEQQNTALQAKQEEVALQRERLLKIQAEAELNERRVRELDTKLRMSEDANKALQLSQRNHNSSLEQFTSEKEELKCALRRAEEQLDKMLSENKRGKENERELAARAAGLQAENAAREAERDRLALDLEQARCERAARAKEVETVTDLLDKLDREYRQLQSKFLNQHSAAPAASGTHGDVNH